MSGFYRSWFHKGPHIYRSSCSEIKSKFDVLKVTLTKNILKIIESVFGLDKHRNRVLFDTAATRVSAVKGLLRVLVDTCHKLKQSMFHLWGPVTLVYP